jgi:MFS family permease
LLLALGYTLAALMSIAIIALPVSIGTLALIFILGGTNVGLEETLEDSLAAELVTKEQHGMAFGVMASVNGIGDFISSIVVGVLWSAFGISVAFGYSAVLSIAGAILILFLPSRNNRV